MANEVKLDLGAFRDAIASVTKRRIQSFITALRDRILKSFEGRKTGRFYRRPKPRRGFYQASAPGQPPAIASGRLAKAIRSVRGRFISPFEAEAVIDVPYARLLEEGTERMAPRPFVRPALEAVSKRFKTVGGQL